MVLETDKSELASTKLTLLHRDLSSPWKNQICRQKKWRQCLELGERNEKNEYLFYHYYLFGLQFGKKINNET